MAEFAPRAVLLRVTKAQSRDFTAWEEGIHHTTLSRRTISDLRARVVEDRFIFAREFLRSGDDLLTQHANRSALSRYYYAMYHATRAVAFHAHNGDDHQEHRELPKHIPNDFPDQDQWQNRLKDAREVRNRADYDPYPKAQTAWRADAERLATVARELVGEARLYLVGKGYNRL